MVTQRRLERIKKAALNRQQGVVVLQDIIDKHNAFAVIRSCECFGIQKVYLIFEKKKAFDPTKFGKLAAASANKWIDYEIFDSTEKCIKKLKEENYKIIATALTDNSTSIFEFDFCASEKFAICFGNEKEGLSDSLIEQSDAILNIPMQGLIQSLNLSVTAAICLFEMTRQRRKAGFENFKYSLEEQKNILDKFLIEKCN
jgi:tRNA (guanosine-2'-O-)-methyltransferase